MIQYDENGETSECEVLDYITQELAADEVEISHPIYARILREAQHIDRELARRYGDMKQEQSLPRLREALQVQLDEIHSKEIAYIGHTYINNPDMELSSVAIDLMSDRHQLSKIHTKYQVIERDVDRLNELIPRAVFELKDAILMRRIEELRNALRHLQSASANDEVLRVMEQIAQYMEVRKSLALYLGERIIPAKTK